MNISEMAVKVYEIAHEIRSYGVLYSGRLSEGRRILQARKMLQRRIETLRSWLDEIEIQLREDEKKG